MTGHIFIEGEIGDRVTSETVRNDIAQYPHAEEFIVHINSVGGDVYEGYNIAHIIAGLGKKTTAQIGALCASIATFVAMRCDYRVMGPVGDFMIHLPTGTIQGTADDLRKGAAVLDRIKGELISGYAPNVYPKGVSPDQLSKMIDVETSMSPQEALKMGFIHEVQEKMKAVAKYDFKKFNMETKEKEGLLEAFGKKIDKIFDMLTKVKNVTITLADGTQVESTAEDPSNLVGSTITGPDGPLAAGTYETIDGYSLVVSEGGMVESQEPITNDDTEMDKLKNENEELKKQLAALTEQKQNAEAVQAKQNAKYVNEIKQLKAEYEKIKNETFGDKTVPTDANNKTAQVTNTKDPLLEQMTASLWGSVQDRFK